MGELRILAAQLLREARALRDAYPDAGRMAPMTFGAIGADSESDGGTVLRAALRYLRDEMAVVRDGRAGGLTVLDDEIANVEWLTWGAGQELPPQAPL